MLPLLVATFTNNNKNTWLKMVVQQLDISLDNKIKTSNPYLIK